MNTKGLTVNIFQAKDFPNCSGNGISETFNRLILVPNEYFPEIPKIFDADNEGQLIHIVGKRIGDKIYYHTESVNRLDKNMGKNGPMFGGQFIYTSDSRFPFNHPIALHDRYETII